MLNFKIRSLISCTAAAAMLALSAPVLAGANHKQHEQRVETLQGWGSFALIGDTPYGVATEPQFDRVIDSINRDPSVRFVIHTGDIKGGGERCDDALLQHRFDQYQRFKKPFILTPGDNDWTDCHRTSNGSYLPTERLSFLRGLFYPQAGVTTGARKARVTTQANQAGFETFVENTMWHFAGTVMGTLHVVGSNNNLAPWNQYDAADTASTPRADRIAEFTAREAAALAWIDRIFDEATRSKARGVLIAMQANPLFEVAASNPNRDGFNAILDKITARAIAFKKPVVIAHGDSHYFRVDKPLTAATATGSIEMLENVTRVENFGSQYVHWVEVKVNPFSENVFSFEQRIIEANKFAR